MPAEEILVQYSRKEFALQSTASSCLDQHLLLNPHLRLGNESGVSRESGFTLLEASRHTLRAIINCQWVTKMKVWAIEDKDLWNWEQMKASKWGEGKNEKFPMKPSVTTYTRVFPIFELIMGKPRSYNGNPNILVWFHSPLLRIIVVRFEFFETPNSI